MARPPITARPRGAFCSPPSPRPSAIGTMPMTMARAVIIRGASGPRRLPGRPGSASRPRCKFCAGKSHDQHAVGGGHAHAHDGPHQGRNAQGGLRQEQQPNHARQRARQSGDDDEGIDPGLEIDHQQQVDQHDAQRPARGQPDEGGMHCLRLAAQDDPASARQFLFRLFDQGLMSRRTPPRSRPETLPKISTTGWTS